MVGCADLSNSQPNKAELYKTVYLQNCKPVDKTEKILKSYKSYKRAVFCNERATFRTIRCQSGITCHRSGQTVASRLDTKTKKAARNSFRAAFIRKGRLTLWHAK